MIFVRYDRREFSVAVFFQVFCFHSRTKFSVNALFTVLMLSECLFICCIKAKNNFAYVLFHALHDTERHPFGKDPRAVEDAYIDSIPDVGKHTSNIHSIIAQGKDWSCREKIPWISM